MQDTIDQPAQSGNDDAVDGASEPESIPLTVLGLLDKLNGVLDKEKRKVATK